MAFAPPRTVLLLRPDGMGDVILFQPVLAALQVGWPGAKIAVLVRSHYCGLGALLFPGITWLGTVIDPFRQGPAEVEAELTVLKAAVERLAPDLVVATTEQRTWLDTAIGAMAGSARQVAFGTGGEDAYFGPLLRSLYPEIPAQPFAEVVAAGTDEAAWRRSTPLANYLLNRNEPLLAPKFTTALAWTERARPLLDSWGIAPGAFVLCTAAGFANVALKTWPPDRFVAVLRGLRAERGMAAVLVGSAAEADYLRPIAAAADARLWISDGTDWETLCALVAASRAVLGNDTGLLHLAAALGRPVVGIYGGGTWPRFIPAGPGAVVVNPLPCFGCGWDCAFGDAPCVKLVAAADVAMALAHVLDVELHGDCAVMDSHHILPETAALMGQAAERYAGRGEELKQRERQFQETVRLAAAKDGEIRQLKRETDTKDREIASLKAITLGMDREILALKAAAELRGDEANVLRAQAISIQEEADRRTGEIEKLHRAAAELQRACDERLELIKRLDAEVKQLHASRGASA
jgi:ADP-heptose:LPS heptosyltransferase